MFNPFSTTNTAIKNLTIIEKYGIITYIDLFVFKWIGK